MKSLGASFSFTLDGTRTASAVKVSTDGLTATTTSAGWVKALKSVSSGVKRWWVLLDKDVKGKESMSFCCTWWTVAVQLEGATRAACDDGLS